MAWRSASTFVTESSGATSQKFNYPYMSSIQAGRLIVCDYSNHRVLIWNSVPSTNNAAADIVLGQTTMTGSTSNAGGLGPSSLSYPGDVQWDGSHLFVVDYNNHRLLAWNSFPTTSGAAADAVLGQDDFVSNTADAGGLGSSSMHLPWGMTLYQGEMWLSDYGNHRVLKFDLP